MENTKFKDAEWWAKDLHGYDKNAPLPTNDVEVNSFMEGYNKSQETHPYSIEDMIGFMNWRERNCYLNTNGQYQLILGSKGLTTKELIKMWEKAKDLKESIVNFSI